MAKRRGKQPQSQHEEARHLVDEDDDEEMVAETQFQAPPPNLTRTRGGAPSVPKKAGGTQWSEEECEALTKAWLCYSENSVDGNNQKSDKLWSDIIPYFFKLMDRAPYRSYDAIVSKWTSLKRELTDFLAIVNKAKLNIESGTNNIDFMDKVHRIYNKKNNKPFTHHLAYKVAESHVTWFKQKTTEEFSTEASSDSNKRPRSESSFGGVDINDINLNNEFEDFDEEDVQAINTGRPTGRDRARKEAKGKGAATSTDEQFSGKWDEHLEFVKGKDKRKQEIEGKQKSVLDQYNATLESQQMLADVDILMRMPDGTLHESNKDLVSDIQRKIRERYGK